jgi:hypothetical protein
MARGIRVVDKLPAPAEPPPSVPPKSTADFAKVRPPKRPRGAPSVPPGARARFVRELAEFRAEGLGAHRMGGGHFVAMYADLHEKVYGIAPVELDDGKVFHMAKQAADRLLEKHFGGDPGEMVTFVLWVWDREKGREDWRRGGIKSGGRIGWRLQFGGALVSDYRLDAVRRNGHARPAT